MTRYLLGDLSEAEQTALELECLADGEKFEDVWAAEYDLVDRYARGELSRRERELFERNYLRSPLHRERVAVARELLGIIGRQAAESAVAPAPGGLIETLKALLTPRFLAPAAVLLALLSVASWMMIERSRMSGELEKVQAQLSDQRRREREIEDRLLAEREQNDKLKSEIDRLLETIAQKPAQSPPSVFSFLLAPAVGTREGAVDQQIITIPPRTDLVRLRLKVGKGDWRSFQATIRAVGGPQVWERRSLKPQSGAITVNMPANRLPEDDYILTLSATTPTGETEEINRYPFRILRKTRNRRN